MMGFKIIRSKEKLGLLDDLGDAIIVEILIRLPSETAERCKAVCKRWYALLSDHRNYFIRRCIHHRHQFPPANANSFSLAIQSCFLSIVNKRLCGELCQNTSQVDIVSENPFICQMFKDHIVDMRFIPCAQRPYRFRPFSHKSHHVFLLEASCDDLLLCSFNDRSTSMNVYHICNIITKQWIALPPICMSSEEADIGLLCDHVPRLDCNQHQTISDSGVCYNFKIVRIPLGPLSLIKAHSKINIQIFSSQEGCWINSQVSLTRILKAGFYKTRLIAYNRMLHKLTNKGVVVFDPFSESQVYRIIDLPPGVSIEEFSCCFGVSQGNLRLGKRSGDKKNSSLEVWELEDYKKGKWCLAYYICMEGLFFRGQSLPLELKILSFHPNERNTLYLRISDYIVQCNMQQPVKLEVLHQFQLASGFSTIGVQFSWMNAFPLVHPWWPTPVPPVPLSGETL